MTPETIQSLFTGPDGRFLCARWGRPIVPVIFGVDDATLGTLKGAIEAMVALAGHKMAETDMELGANLMVFFFRDWSELPQVPKLDRLMPDLAGLCARLGAQDANQYRACRFDPKGAIRAVFLFVRLDKDLAEMPAEDLALVLAARVMLTWSDGAFALQPPLATTPGGAVMLHPTIADLIRAAYAPSLPAVATDPSHALRLAARMSPPRVEN